MSNTGSRLDDFEARLHMLGRQLLDGLPERSRALREAAGLAGRGDPASLREVQRLAHRIAGVAGSHGLTDLGQLARRVEAEVRDGSSSEAVRLALELADAAEAAAPSEVAGAEAAEDGEPGVSCQGVRVLVVDDDPDAVRLLSLLLGRLGGCQVTATGRPDEAIERVCAGDIDVVVADAMMNEVDGLGFCRRVRGRLGVRRSPPIIMVSASTPEDLGWKHAEGGPDAWLMKPVNRDRLLRTVRRLAVGRDQPST